MRIMFISLFVLVSTPMVAMQRISTTELRMQQYSASRKMRITSSAIVPVASKYVTQKRNYFGAGFLCGWFLSDVLETDKKCEQELQHSRELCDLLHTYKIIPHEFENIAAKKMHEHGVIVIKDLEEKIKENELLQANSFFKTTEKRLKLEKAEMKDELTKRKQMLEEWPKK